MGFFYGIMQTSFSSLVMTNSEEKNRGRVFSIINSLNNVTGLVGITLAAPLGNLFGPNIVLFIVGLFIIGTGIYGKIRFDKNVIKSKQSV
ncbi:hypothetical protein J9303_09175 [Bacillaceae bacterium Marseille-Q3522]|nr:hypothetical protein [Bacillaceae bacterium Marseille-Q3522]